MNKRELKEILKEDKNIYFDKFGIKYLYRKITKYPFYEIGRYVIVARKAGYYNLNRNNFWNICLSIYFSRKKNMLGQKLNIEFGPDEFGRRLRIYHGNIVVNGYSKIGDDCVLYGSNCIGNKGELSNVTEAPNLGNNVSVGVGTKIIGNVNIGNNVSISAASLVNRCLEKENAVYAGTPVKYIKDWKV